MKELVGKEIAQRIKDGEIIGVGTGSTVDAALDQLEARIKREKIRIGVVPTSYETARRCASLGLSVLSPNSIDRLDWGFDGADEVDEDLRLIKGRGGAMLQEKILAAKCQRFIVIIDESKLVKRLGEKFPVPVEIIPEALGLVKDRLRDLGATKVELRQASGKHGAVITEKGNLILDASFAIIKNELEREIKSLVGVVENGLFIGYADEVLVAGKSGIVSYPQ